MKLGNGISYHQFGNRVYVHSVDTQKDYIIEGVAPDVLEYLAQKDCSTKELVDWLSELYETNDKTELEKDIRKFVEELIAEKIL